MKQALRMAGLFCALFFFDGDAFAQSTEGCDSTIIVDSELSQSINVHAALAEWIPANARVELVFNRPLPSNRTAVARQLVRAYPPRLRDRGIGGEVLFAILVDTTGAVAARRMLRTSGYRDLDQAADGVISTIRYKPLKSEQGCAVPAVLRMPIVFKTRP